MFEWYKKEKPVFTGIARGVGGFAFGKAAAGGGAIPFSATGGTKTTDGSYTIHTFTSSGSFQITSPGQVSRTIDYLVIAGGGAGGSGMGGGGGAGGYRTTMPEGPGGPSPSVESASTLSGPLTYTVTIGGGGTGSLNPTPSNGAGTQGTSSAFGPISTTGGGGGGTYATGNNMTPGGSGGGYGGSDSGPSGPGGSGTAGQGWVGGNRSSRWAGGGGGTERLVTLMVKDMEVMVKHQQSLVVR